MVLADQSGNHRGTASIGMHCAHEAIFRGDPGLKKSDEFGARCVAGPLRAGVALLKLEPWQNRRLILKLGQETPKVGGRQYSLAFGLRAHQAGAEAVDLLEKVLQMSPDHFRANLLWKNCFLLQAIGAAVSKLEKAIQVAPNSAEGAQLFSRCLPQLGRDADAAREARTRAKSLPRQQQ